MKKILLLIPVLLLGMTNSWSQCSENDEDKILLVGDSWAFFMNADGTINDILEEWGHSNKTYFTNLTLSENGAETDDFLEQSKLDEIEYQLLTKTEIDYVHLSLGGNDVLGSWNVNFTQAETDSLKDTVFNRLTTIIEFIKDVRPGVKVVWSGYMYPNFEEVIESFAPFQSSHPFYGTWQGMGFPSFQQLNELLNEFSAQIEAYANADPDVFFVNSTGLMQYEFGQTTPLGVAPGGSYPPYSQPLPAGDVTYPSPRETMRDYGITRDCFHLSGPGYMAMMRYQAQKFYQKALMDDQYLLSEIGASEGSVSSGGTVSTVPKLGENAGNTTGMILTFNTTQMLLDTLDKASIFIRRNSLLSGTNPIGSEIEVRVVQGNFGLLSDIEAADYTDMGDASATACVFGSYGQDEDWLRIDLPVEIFSKIKSSDQTQFFISSTSTGGEIAFYDGSNPEFAPVLNLDYAGFNLGVYENDVEVIAHELVVYPNPTNGLLNIRTNGMNIASVEVYNTMGQMVKRLINVDQQINLSDVPAGNYILKVIADNTVINKKIIIK